MVKAVFFDIDGTLVSFKTHKVSESTRNSIHQLRKKGIKVFIATGRSKNELTAVDGIEFDGYIVMNGSHCFTPNGKDIYKDSIPHEDINRLVEWLQTDSTPFVFVVDDQTFITRINETVEEVARIVEVDIPPVKSEKEALGKDILQVMGYLSPEKEVDFMKNIMPHCDSMRWCSYFTDIIAAGNSKRSGIDRILNYYDISLENTMAFGDGGNDIPMLKHVAIGIAMGNANDEVKEAADYVTTSVDEDGILRALEHFGVL